MGNIFYGRLNIFDKIFLPPHLRAGAQQCPDLCDLGAAAGDDIDHAPRQPRLLQQRGQGEGGEGRVLAWLDHAGAA